MFTLEQQNVIKNENPIRVVNAVAGAGKSTTLIGVIQERPLLNHLILCFNKSIQMELNKKCSNINNVSAYTFHGMAFTFFRNNSTQYISDFTKRNFISEYDIFQIKEIFERLKIKFKDYYELQFFKTHLNKFFYSDKTEDEYFEKFSERKEDYKKFINEIITNSETPVPHDFYLKIFQLKVKLKHNFDCVIIDEAQDLNSCNFAIISNLNIKNRCLLGDNLQQLYNFRGADNALVKETNAEQLQLSGSFRVGRDIAFLSNNIIWSFLKTKQFKMIGKNNDQIIVDKLPKNERISIICRTNAGIIERLLINARNGMYSSIVGGKETLRFDIIKGLFKTKLNKPFIYLGKTIINNINEAKKLQILLDDRDLKRSINFIETHKEKTLEYLELMERFIIDEDKSDFILTTVHKAKGLEFEYVEIHEDFPNLYDLIKKKDNKDEEQAVYDEIYILYVAITRSKKHIKLNSSLKAWLTNNQKYYKNKKELRTNA